MADEVTNISHAWVFTSPLAQEAKAAMDADELEVLADRGYFSEPQIKACEELGAVPLVPKPGTSGSKDAGQFDGSEFA